MKFRRIFPTSTEPAFIASCRKRSTMRRGTPTPGTFRLSCARLWCNRLSRKTTAPEWFSPCGTTAAVSTNASFAGWECWVWKSAFAGWVENCESNPKSAGGPPFRLNSRYPSWLQPKHMPPIRILLADDHTMVRDGLRALLDRQHGLAIVAEAADDRECIQLAEEHSPDVVMMDIAMPKMNGIEATRRILADNPATGVVILSMHQDESYVLQSLKAGAKGYLLKDSPREDILEAIRCVANGRAFLSRKVSRMLQEDYVEQLRSKGLDDTFELLTDREREILQLLAEGRANKEVAGLLNISPTTVETHRGHILRKLSLHGTADLILYAVRKKIIC